MNVATRQQTTRKTRKQYCCRPFWEKEREDDKLIWEIAANISSEIKQLNSKHTKENSNTVTD